MLEQYGVDFAELTDEAQAQLFRLKGSKPDGWVIVRYDDFGLVQSSTLAKPDPFASVPSLKLRIAVISAVRATPRALRVCQGACL
ncbi:MAG UNVERIFIED_CONTAM: hypothetical protein LVT10_09900 [Anaerolineae bacterium]